MIGCGFTTFTSPDDYRCNVPGLSLKLFLHGGTQFRARVTWAGLARMKLVDLDEKASRIAFISFTEDCAFISFPLHDDPPQTWNGVRLRRGDFVLHLSRQSVHHCTEGPARWGVISLRADDLARFSRTLLGTEIGRPASAVLLRPARCVSNNVLRLHGQACRLARQRHDTLAHGEVRRALEQHLIAALVSALSERPPDKNATAPQRHVEVMQRLEHVLAAEPRRQLSLPELSAAVGVPQRTLRICCEEFVGCSPSDYARLRRLNFARAALARQGDVTVAQVARTFGFTAPGRFAALYRTTFGELPSVTLRGRGSKGARQKSAEFA